MSLSKYSKYFEELLKIYAKENILTLSCEIIKDEKIETIKQKLNEKVLNKDQNVESQIQDAEVKNIDINDEMLTKVSTVNKKDLKINEEGGKNLNNEEMTILKKKDINSEEIQIYQDLKKCTKIEDIKNLLNTKDILYKDFFLNRFAKNIVIGDGSLKAKILLIGEAPGETEDETGIPFCGRSGKLLEQALIKINLLRESNLYITNTVFWRPEDNRKPSKNELEFCFPFLNKIIEIINPEIIITTGSVATELIIKKSEGAASIVGNFFDIDFTFTKHTQEEKITKTIKCLPVYHPSYLLRNPISKKVLWENLLTLKRELERLGLIS